LHYQKENSGEKYFYFVHIGLLWLDLTLIPSPKVEEGRAFLFFLDFALTLHQYFYHLL